MTEQNESPIGEETDVQVDFQAKPAGEIILTQSVWGMSPSLTVEADYDEEEDLVIFRIRSYGTDNPAEMLETIADVLTTVAGNVALEQERLSLEQEKDVESQESTDE